MFLGDYGAEVIKVEHPATGDPQRQLGQRKNAVPLWWKQISRNKKSITLYLGSPEGQALFKRLVATADVVVENYRPGTMERWGLGWDGLHEITPGLVMLRVSGFGQTGPYKQRPGFGTLAEAMSGFAHITGEPDGPPTLPPFGLADGIAAITGAFAVMVALYHREHTGEGQYIDLSLYEPIFSLLGPQVVEYAQLGIVQNRIGNRVPFSVPRGAYRTKDNKWVALSGSSQSIAERIFRAIGRPDMNEDPRFQTMSARVANAALIDEIIRAWMAEHTRDEIIRVFEQHEAALGPVYNVADIFEDPHVKARENIVAVPDGDLGPIWMQGIFPKLSATPGRIRWTGPRRGQHNREIFVERLGIMTTELEQLHAKGVI
jgi:formyl-CoA transferase